MMLVFIPSFSIAIYHLRTGTKDCLFANIFGDVLNTINIKFNAKNDVKWVQLVLLNYPTAVVLNLFFTRSKF